MAIYESTLTHLFRKRATLSHGKTAFMRKVNGVWEKISYGEYTGFVEEICFALIDSGISRGDRVAILSDTRMEWALADLGILSCGAITIPIYQSNVSAEVEYILKNSESKAVFVENEVQLKKVLSVKENLPLLKQIILFDPVKTAKGEKDVIPFENFCQRGLHHKEGEKPDFNELLLRTSPADVASIVYTSGTTGQPKGVVLTHGNFISELSDIAKAFPQLTDHETVLTFLPYAHILARIEHYCGLLFGWTAAFAESIPKLVENLAEVKPTFMFSVPRIYEKVFNKIIGQVEAGSALKKKIFYWSLWTGREASRLRQKRMGLPFRLRLQLGLADKFVFSKLRRKFGGRIRFFISGGAPLSREIAEFFHAAGFLILEGYGLTETTAAIFINREEDYEFGTVGKPLGNVQLKFADDGEILIKGGEVFMEYYKDPEATREAFSDGWYHTGDIGMLTKEGNLKITDRKKDIIVTSGGKNIAPQKIESLLKTSHFISQAMVHGNGKHYLTALLTLNREEIEHYARKHQIPIGEDLYDRPEIHELIRKIVEGKNEILASFETIKKFTILKNDFSIETGELTPSMKIKRKFCYEKYRNILETMYEQ